MIKKIVTEKFVNNEGFEFSLEPIESSLNIKKTKTGFEARYLSQENDPQNPREDTNYTKMVCFHKQYTLGDKIEDDHLNNENNFTSWEEVKKYIQKELKAIFILPLFLYDHSGISIATAPHGIHAAWDCGQVGFIYLTAAGLKEWGVSKEKALKYMQSEVEVYNQYLTGDCYIIVKETFDKNKNQISQDNVGNYFGYEESLKALETDI